MATRAYNLILANSIYSKYETKGALLNYLSNNAWIAVDKTKRPLKVNYVYDESLDTFQAGFLSKTLDYKLPNLTLCRIIYEGYEPLYDTLGKPTNHDVCIIANGSCKYIPNATYYSHDYNLVELMHLMKYVRMETLSFTSQEEISVTDPVTEVTTTYVKEPYNLYTMLVRILKLTRTSTNLEDNSWLSKIHIMDVDLLKASGIGVDDVFVENTLYDSLFKIGHYIGRVPVLYLNKDYDSAVSDSKEYLLFFERKDGLGGNEITKEELFTNHKGWVESQNEDKDADTVVSDVHNMVSNRPCSYPSDDYFCFPTGEENLYELNESAERKMVLPHKISEIISILQLEVETIIAEALNPTTGYLRYKNINVYEYKNWIGQQDRDTSAYFKEGENIIYFGNEIAKPKRVSAPLGVTIGKYYLYNVKYYPMADAKIVAKKGATTNYETTFNQVDNYIDASTYGHMLQEYINQHGSADVTIMKKYRFSNDVNKYMAMPKIGDIVRYSNGDKYLITNMSFDVNLDCYDVIYQLNKNYVRRNAFTQASQRIRNEGISYDKMYERFTNLNESIHIEMSERNIPIVNNSLKYVTNKKVILAGLIEDNSTVKNLLIQAAYMKFSSSVEIKNMSTTLINKYLVGNVAKTQNGKNILLNTKYNNNIIAASNIISITNTNILSDIIQIQSHIKYVDPFGGAQKVQIGFGKYEDIQPKTDSEIVDYSAYIDFAKNYPAINQAIYDNYYNLSGIKISELIYDKDVRETFNFTYQLQFKNHAYTFTNQEEEDISVETIVTDEFVKYCGLLGDRINTTTLKIVILKDGVNIGADDIITSDDRDFTIPISDIVYYNDTDSIKLALDNSYNYYGKTYALVYQVGIVYKPLLIKKWVGSATNTIYIHV